MDGGRYYRRKGTKNNPYQITNNAQIPPEILICKLRSHMRIENRNINNINIAWSRNITISNCFIVRLTLSYSTDLVFENNSLKLITLDKSKGLRFKHNELPYNANQTMPKIKFLSILDYILDIMLTISFGLVVFTLSLSLRFTGIFNYYGAFFLSLLILFSVIWSLNAYLFLKKFKFYIEVRTKSNEVI